MFRDCGTNFLKTDIEFSTDHQYTARRNKSLQHTLTAFKKK